MKTKPNPIEIATIKAVSKHELDNNIKFTRISQTESYNGKGERIYRCFTKTVASPGKIVSRGVYSPCKQTN